MSGRKGTALLLGTLCWLVGLSAQAAGDGPTLGVAVVSDLNSSYGSTDYSKHVDAAIRRIIDLKPDLVLVTGDMIAGQRQAPRLERSHLEAMWRVFHERVTDKLSAAGIPLLPVPGNHDASAEPGFDLERVIYEETWRDRRPEVDLLDDSDFPFRYTFVMGNVLFVGLDATRVEPLSDEQRGWLEGVLADQDAGITSQVVFGHLPVWPVSKGGESEILGDLKLEQIFLYHGVDLYLSGHHHAFYPGVHNSMLYVSQACVGSGPRPLLGQDRPSVRAITLLTIGSGGTLDVQALTGDDFSEPLDLNSLPRAIRYNDVEIVRYDLAGARARVSH